jgi:cytochrome d ubiquinol oxidase subunit II
MSLAALIAVGVGFALTAYAIFAGADFGAGILDLTFGASPQPRGALACTIGPLWEANHVWLIFTITILSRRSRRDSRPSGPPSWPHLPWL